MNDTVESTLPLPSEEVIFQDTSTDCAICLEALDDSSSRVLTLTCGHKWHYDCIVQQLETAQPSRQQRLLFTGCQCAKCGSVCNHPDLDHLTRTTDSLRERVDKLLNEQLALDAPMQWHQARNNKDKRKALLDYARRKYAFYLCSHCREPYFGGTVECADLEQDGEEERLCVACSPQSQATCRNPLEHRQHLVWKCRYCCRPSTHLCYGNVHFCDACHEQNSQRVRQLQTTRRLSKRSSIQPPPLLEPTPCPGIDCPYPKPEGTSIHSNGPTSKSEQVYGCAWCQSITTRDEPAVAPGSINLLYNPSGQFQLQGWQQLNPRMSWTVETSDVPVNAATPSNFVSSFLPCVMQQVLDLTTIMTTTTTMSTNHQSLEVSARYMGRTDCPSVFGLKAVLMDAQRRPLSHFATPVLEAPPDYWDRAELIVPLDNINAKYLTVIVMGKDSRFWQGRFGSKVTNVSVRLLGSPNQIDALLRPAYRLQATNNNVGDDNTVRRHHLGHHHHRQVRVIPPQQQQRNLAFLICDGLLPVVFFLVLAWLFQS